MPRVFTQKRTRAGKPRKCGRIGCDREIQPGETYYLWSFRYGGKHFRCSAHPPTPGELTQSKMGSVYDAIEDARANLGTLEEIKDAIQSLAETAREVVEEYREAAESFGGSGPNAERADELESWVDELEQFEPDESEETEFDEEEHREEALELVAQEEDITLADAMQNIRDEWQEEHGDDAENAAETAREQAEDLLSSCPV